jgi:flagellar hook-length control protein FliK
VVVSATANPAPATLPPAGNVSTTSPPAGATTGARNALEEPHLSPAVSTTSTPAPAAIDRSAPAPAATGGTAPAPPVLSYGVGLQQAIETVHATIELASRQGLSQARIALHPEELGEIRIHLSQSAQGLIARVTADTPAAAQALAEGHAELRQSLDSLGLTALHMDTSAFNQAGMQQREGRAHQPFAFATSDSQRASSPDGEDDQDALLGATPDPAEALGLSRGALVDVLA